MRSRGRAAGVRDESFLHQGVSREPCHPLHARPETRVLSDLPRLEGRVRFLLRGCRPTLSLRIIPAASVPRDSSRYALALVLTGVGCARVPRTGVPAPPSPVQPNIVLVVTDDMAAADLAHMPRVKSLLGDRGLTFNRAFVTDSVCTPSRASILTGRYPHNHGALDNAPPLGGFKKFRQDGKEAATFATWLQAAGYRTALVGKYLNGYPGPERRYVPPGWDEWFGLFFPEPYYDYVANHGGRLERHAHAPEDYQSDVLAARAVDFVARRPAAAGPSSCTSRPMPPTSPTGPPRGTTWPSPISARPGRPPSTRKT
ncbi:MAG: hypothetical protein DMF81_25345 [Acidobacteria bacterium]|nr:MAG: hypothetical protein DMF81_25345 [Acidobacteriota bacterium]